MTAFLIVFGAVCFVSLVLVGHEMKHAQIVDSKEPFLYGDYDPKKDETLE